MSEEITRVEHRHGDQKKNDPDLVLEVGKRLPSIYGRRQGLKVKSIEGGNPMKCILDDGDVIYIGERNVRGITRAKRED